MFGINHTMLQEFLKERAIPFFLVAAMFFIPISSSGKSITIPIALLCILFVPEYRKQIKAFFREPWAYMALLIFFLVLTACFWTPASMHDQCLMIEKYSKLLYLPILAVGFQKRTTRTFALHAFLAAMIVTSLLSWFAFMGWYHGRPTDFVFRNHIITGHMMAFAAYLCAYLCMRTERYSAKIFYILGILLFSYQTLFISTGRTGYVIYILLLGLWMQQMLSWRTLLWALGFAMLLMAAIYTQSSSMQNGLHSALSELKHYQHRDKDTSIGFRLQFHAFAKEQFLIHPYFGNGTGSFTTLFAEKNPVPVWNKKLLEPHSQYWLFAVEFGVLGIILLFFFLAGLFKAIIALPNLRPIALALWVSFIVGNLSDSLLLYSGPGYFFLSLLALCFGEKQASMSYAVHQHARVTIKKEQQGIA